VANDNLFIGLGNVEGGDLDLEYAGTAVHGDDGAGRRPAEVTAGSVR
jgi:hypothetical protein